MSLIKLHEIVSYHFDESPVFVTKSREVYINSDYIISMKSQDIPNSTIVLFDNAACPYMFEESMEEIIAKIQGRLK